MEVRICWLFKGGVALVFCVFVLNSFCFGFRPHVALTLFSSFFFLETPARFTTAALEEACRV